MNDQRIQLFTARTVVVCVPICLSVMMDCDDMRFNSSKIISRMTYADPNNTDLFQREQWEHPRILAGIGVG